MLPGFAPASLEMVDAADSRAPDRAASTIRSRGEPRTGQNPPSREGVPGYPGVVTRAALVRAAMLVGVLALAGCGQSDLGTPQEYATALFDGINEEREAAHLAPLEWSDCLADKALPRAQVAATADTL